MLGCWTGSQQDTSPLPYFRLSMSQYVFLASSLTQVSAGQAGRDKAARQKFGLCQQSLGWLNQDQPAKFVYCRRSINERKLVMSLPGHRLGYKNCL